MDSTLSKIVKLYSSNLAEYGDVSKAVGWSTLESQILRFEKLTTVVDRAAGPITVNDYGCGYGAHLDYLTSNGVSVAQYNGYDVSCDMLSQASKSLGWFKGKLALIQSAQITTHADYTFASGTFNVRFDSSDEDWTEFIKQKLNEINQFSTRGFSFNLLSSFVDWRESHLFYGDPAFWFDYCKRTFSRRVSLLHDYPLYEWTVIVQKEVPSRQS